MSARGSQEVRFAQSLGYKFAILSSLCPLELHGLRPDPVVHTVREEGRGMGEERGRGHCFKRGICPEAPSPLPPSLSPTGGEPEKAIVSSLLH